MYPERNTVVGANVNRRQAVNFDKIEYGYPLHIHVEMSHETLKTEETIVDGDVEISLTNWETEIKGTEARLKILEGLCQLKAEETMIVDGRKQFANFLKANAILPYNDSTTDFMILFCEDVRPKILQQCNDNHKRT